MVNPSTKVSTLRNSKGEFSLSLKREPVKLWVVLGCSTLTGLPKILLTNTMKSVWSTPTTKLSAVIQPCSGLPNLPTNIVKPAASLPLVRNPEVSAMATDSPKPSVVPAMPLGKEETPSNSTERGKHLQHSKFHVFDLFCKIFKFSTFQF